MEEDKILQPIGEPVNAVLLETEKDPRRWLFGANSKIVWKNLNSSGNWMIDKPSDERQSNRFIDSWGCTNFTPASSFEVQLQFQVRMNMLSPRALAFLNGDNCANISFFDENGKINLSDKWFYIKTGTIPGVGNYIWKTPDCAKNKGFIPEAMLPFGNPKVASDLTNPEQITPLMEQLAEEAKSIFTVQYEEIDLAGIIKSDARKILQKKMQHSPLILAIACCPGYNTDNPIAMCYQDSIHCVAAMNIEDILTTIYDSYQPFIKNLGKDYLLPYIMQAIIFEKNNETTMKAIKTQDSPHIYLVNHTGDKKIMIVDVPTLEALKVPFEIVSQEELDKIPTAGTLVWAEREI